MLLNSLKSVIPRLRRGQSARKQFVESHLNKTVAFQIRAIRDRLGWSQDRLAREVGMNQNAISRLESPEYGKPTLTTLKRLAAAFDVALVVRFVPFSELVDWTTSTPRVVKGLGTESLAVPDFETEENAHVFDQALQLATVKAQLEQLTAADFSSRPATVFRGVLCIATANAEYAVQPPVTRGRTGNLQGIKKPPVREDQYRLLEATAPQGGMRV